MKFDPKVQEAKLTSSLRRLADIENPRSFSIFTMHEALDIDPGFANDANFGKSLLRAMEASETFIEDIGGMNFQVRTVPQHRKIQASSPAPSLSDAPAPSHEREAYQRGRKDAAVAREYGRGLDDDLRGAPDEQRGHAGPSSFPSAGQGSRAASTSGPFAERNEMEKVDAASRIAWDADVALRAEFPSFESFAAFRRATVQGRARLFSRQTVKSFTRADFTPEELARPAR